MDEIERKSQHRLLALDTTDELQKALGFGDQWRRLVENTIYALIEDGYRRGSQYGRASTTLTFNVYHKAGPLRNGAERGHGTIWHAVPGDYTSGADALCGARPKIMWSRWSPEGQEVTCPKCQRAIAKATATTDTHRDSVNEQRADK